MLWLEGVGAGLLASHYVQLPKKHFPFYRFRNVGFGKCTVKESKTCMSSL